MTDAPLDVLYEDNHLLALAKPPGLPTMGVSDGRPTLLSLAKQYVKARYGKPGNVYLGVVSRLDAPTTGVVLLARTSKAARRLTEQFRSHSVRKIYWALVHGVVEPGQGHWQDYLAEDQRHRRMHLVGPSAPGAKEARARYLRLRLVGGNCLLEIEPETGRKHQIRVQSAHRGHPIIGDRKYGSRARFAEGIALHARKLVVGHPVGGSLLVIEAPLPDAWQRMGIKP